MNGAGWLLVGIVGSPHGLRGEVRVRSETDFPDRFRAGNRLFIRSTSGEPTETEIETVRWHKGSPLIRLRGIHDRNAALMLCGAELLVPDAERMALDDNEYYVSDLIGMEVVTDEGRELGRVDDVLTYSANDVYVVGKTLIPAVRQVVLNVDLAARRITIHPIPGLLEDDAD